MTVVSHTADAKQNYALLLKTVQDVDVNVNRAYRQGRIIHEAVEAVKPQGPGPDRGPDRPVQKKRFGEKICSLVKFLPSGVSIRPRIKRSNLRYFVARCAKVVVFYINNISK